MIERRSAAIEIRAGQGRTLYGHAALYNVEADLGGFREVILPGAFGARSRDILCLADHDPARVLGRTRSGTLKLQDDERGLTFECDVAGTSVGNDVLELVRSGNAGGMSIGFKVGPDGERWQGQRRELRAIDLFEISIVSAHPAYSGTEVTVRSLQSITPPRRRVLWARRHLEIIGR
jgi:HK97 family phage prohead protease